MVLSSDGADGPFPPAAPRAEDARVDADERERRERRVDAVRHEEEEQHGARGDGHREVVRDELLGVSLHVRPHKGERGRVAAQPARREHALRRAVGLVQRERAVGGREQVGVVQGARHPAARVAHHRRPEGRALRR